MWLPNMPLPALIETRRVTSGKLIFIDVINLLDPSSE
jgi:hypothetical protein